MANERSVPTSRLSRFAKLGSLATGVATNMLVGGAKSALSGKGWDNKSLLLQPKNIENLAIQLSHLRGAAMKLAQLLSLLRADANPMPHKQLVSVLKEQWGDDWLSRFSHIELRPFAAASIGQVHLAYIENGAQLAVKIQYPGIAKSVVSDVDNVITLLTLSRLLPKELDIKPLVEEAKAQLLAEADYTLEAQYLVRYKNLLSTNTHFKVPNVYVEHSTSQVLTMEYVDAKPIESICDLPAAERCFVAEQLIDLFFKEMFEFKLIQTDPNFANYHYQPESQKIVLFDFGATREITSPLSDAYLVLFKAGSNNDREGVIDLFLMACEPLRYNGEFDFKNSELASNIKDAGLQLSAQSQQWHTPPVDALFIHRKLAGLYLIAARLEAKINIKALFSHY